MMMIMIEVMTIDHHLNERKSQRKAVKRRITKRKRVAVEVANGIESIIQKVAALVAVGRLRRMQMLIENINGATTTTTNWMMMIPMKKRRERNGRDHQDIMIQIAIPTILQEEVMIERKARRKRNTNPKSPQRDNDDDDITFSFT